MKTELKDPTVLEELAGMNLTPEMRKLFIELYKKGSEGKLSKINLNKINKQ